MEDTIIRCHSPLLDPILAIGRERVTHGNKKTGYDTEDEACEFLHQNPRLKAAGEHPYQCEVCSKWHVEKWHKDIRC